MRITQAVTQFRDTVNMYIRPVIGTAVLFTSGRYRTSGATISVAAAPLLFFVTSDKRQRRCFFLGEKAAALQRCFLSKFSVAAATANKLLPRLFQFTFSHVTVWSIYSPLVFTLLLLPRYFSLLEHTRPL